MRICIDARVPQLGGSRTYTDGLIEGLMKVDTENEYLILWDPVHGGNRYPHVREEIVPWKGRIQSMVWSHSALPRMLHREGFEVYHSVKQLNLFSSRAARIYTFHTAGPYLFPGFYKRAESLHWRIMFKLSARRSEAVIVCSEADRRIYAERARIPERKIRVTYLAAQDRFRPIADPSYLEQERRRLGLPSPYILFVGTIYPFKNVEAVVEGYHLSRVRERTGHKLLIVGRKGWFYDRVLALVRELRIEQDVIFQGYQDEALPVIYNLADLFIFPSHYESFGLPVLEAMSCGVPVIASNAGALPEVVGDAGVLVDRTAVGDIGDAVNEILTSEARRQDLAARSLARARKFSWERCAAATLAVYREFA